MNVYVVTMYRWGNRENHSYLLGAYSSKKKAVTAGDNETSYRGGKYSYEVMKTKIDSSKRSAVVLASTMEPDEIQTQDFFEAARLKRLAALPDGGKNEDN